jgi:hypothetical protein
MTIRRNAQVDILQRDASQGKQHSKQLKQLKQLKTGNLFEKGFNLGFILRPFSPQVYLRTRSDT